MKIKLIFLVVLIDLLISCQKSTVEQIVFVKDGKISDVEIRNLEMKEEGFLQGDDTFFLESEKAIYGDEILVDMKLSISEFVGSVNISVGDNSFLIINEPDEKGMYLQGPSIGKIISIGESRKLIKPDVPFEITVSYGNEKIKWALNGNKLYDEKTNIPPAGAIKIEDEGANVRIYNLVGKGRFKSVEEFYTKEFLLDRAQKSLDRAIKRVKDDPNRPAYHFLPPANWNNDPNGLLFYDGYYHLFYQHNPYGDRWDWMHWGHARSKDLVSWQYLPIALWPSVDKGEEHCFSGSGFIKDNGKPILVYTSIGHEYPEVWAANPEDDSLFNWEKNPADPILVMGDHKGQYIDDWRDPYVFRDQGETYMVVGGHPQSGKGSIMLYKSMNNKLTKWDYLGVPFSGKEENWECPNFFKIGDKYVLIYSPHGRVKYYTGHMDFKNIKFTPDYHGDVDDGQNYYAPNTLQKADGRRVLFGWIPDFKQDQGWQGAITLPRDLSIDEKGRLIQKPVPELTKLRGNHFGEKNVKLLNSSKKLDVDYPQFEMMINISNGGTKEIAFRFSEENGKPYEIILTPQTFFFGDDKVALSPGLIKKIETVQLFFDRTVIEIFVNGGKVCATKVIYLDKDNLNFEIFNPTGELTLKEVNIWQLKSIW